MDRSIKNNAKLFLKGMAIGSAEAVPGVSGGTVALIVGLYERLVGSISSISFKGIISLIKSLKSRDLSEAKNITEEFNIKFFAVLGSGIAVSLTFMLSLIGLLLENFFVITYGVFLGLIAFSALLLLKNTKISGYKAYIFLIAGFIFSFLVSGLNPQELGAGSFFKFISGFLAVTALVLPGISGSLILVILGQYSYLVDAFNSFLDSLYGFLLFEGLKPVISSLNSLIPFLVGAFIGIIISAKVVSKALRKYRDFTSAFLLGLLIGSVRAPFIQVENFLLKHNLEIVSIIPEFVSSIMFGALLVLTIYSVSGSDSFKI